MLLNFILELRRTIPFALTGLRHSGALLKYQFAIFYLYAELNMSVSAVEKKTQSSYIESINACSCVRMRLHLHLRSESCYTLAAYLQACWQAFAQSSAGTTVDQLAFVCNGYC